MRITTRAGLCLAILTGSLLASAPARAEPIYRITPNVSQYSYIDGSSGGAAPAANHVPAVQRPLITARGRDTDSGRRSAGPTATTSPSPSASAGILKTENASSDLETLAGGVVAAFLGVLLAAATVLYFRKNPLFGKT